MGKSVDPIYTFIPPRSSLVDETAGHCRGPRRVACFCAFSLIFPAILISIPLLMRFVVNGSSTYFLSAADMLILDQKISTIWCQAERIRMNTTFNGYITDGDPQLIKSPKPLNVSKTIIVPDDHKEYWGFYLLKGSTFSLSTCAKFKGATVLVIQGRSHLHHCAYTGNADSTGNSDEHSDSDSVERRLPPRTTKFLNGSTTSHEEMTELLKQIQKYVKAHPRGYHHLQTSLHGIFGNFTTSTTPFPVPEEQSDMETGHIVRERRHSNPKFPANADGAYEEDLEFTEGTENTTSASSKEASKPPITIWSDYHAGVLNQSTPNDRSDSESESSFSSSEEALARCEGIIGIFGLNRTENCGSGTFNFNFNYVITESGFYYFIFGSENEKTSNLLQIDLSLERYEYDLPSPHPNCTKVRKCEVGFRFGSKEKVVVSVPTLSSSALQHLDDIYFVETDCVPRTSLYLIFVLLVPIMILVFAFL